MNRFLDALENAKPAAVQLREMEVASATYRGSPPSLSHNEPDSIEIQAWHLTQLSAPGNRTWPDGDWREESKAALLRTDGTLWIYFVHDSLQEAPPDWEKKRIHYAELWQASASTLHAMKREDFIRVADALADLV